MLGAVYVSGAAWRCVAHVAMPQFEDGEHVRDDDATEDGSTAMSGLPPVADNTDEDG